MAATWLGTVIIFAFGFWLTAADTDNRDTDNRVEKNTIALESKADKTYVELNTIALESKADKTYVDTSIKEHEASDIKNFTGLKELMKAYLVGQEALIKSIDKRLERLENKKN